MPTNTYTPIATITLTSSDSEIVFSSIPASFRDLIVVYSNPTSTSIQCNVRFNGDSGSNHSRVFAYAGSSYSTSSGSGTYTSQGIGITSNAQFTGTMQIMDYSATDKHKTSLERSGSGLSSDNVIDMSAGRWANTAAITSLTFFPSSGSFVSGCSFSLWGISA